MELQVLSQDMKMLQKEVAELKGQITALTSIVGVYQMQTTKVEGRLWGAVIMSAGGMAAAIMNFIMGNKH